MSLEFPYPEIGIRIRTRRKKLKKTQEDIAKKIGLKRSSLANIERGNQRILIHQLYAIAGELEVELNTLLPERLDKSMETEIDIPFEMNTGPNAAGATDTIASDIAKIFHDEG